MVRRLYLMVAAVVLLCGWGLPALAAQVYAIDPIHSGVRFSVKHLISMVPGRFTTFEGRVTYDPEAVHNSKVEAMIDAASIDTDNAMRDKHLRTADFFHVENHPKLTFKSTKVGKLADGRLEVVGDLTIRGVTKPVVLTVEILGFGPGMDGVQRGGFHAIGKLNRKDFGVNWNKTLDTGGLVLGDEVSVDLSVEGVLQE